MRAKNDEPNELHPNQIVRFCEGRKYFGLKHTQLDEKIKSGEIPAPMKLSDSGRARGWTGRQILEWQAERAAKRATVAA
jgi:predicted DNA-binding transcriptional regulator AlpA